MNLSLKNPILSEKNALAFIILSGILISLSVSYELEAQRTEPDLPVLENELIILQNNTLMPVSKHSDPSPKTIRKISAVVTAYSSSPWETDDTPYITAAGTQVREGIIANNYLVFGTKIRIPELYGDKVFVVEDRMNWKKGNWHFDIWCENRQKALDFGAEWTIIEILES